MVRRAGGRAAGLEQACRRQLHAGGGRGARDVRLLAREGEAAQAADRVLQPRAARRLRRGHQRGLRRRRGADRQRLLQARRVVARVVAVGAAAQLRGRPALHGRRGALDRAHAARDRDVGADGARARPPAQAARVRRHPQARDLGQGLGGVRAPRVRRLQARAHEPGLLDLRAVGGGGRVLRGDRQEGGPDRGGRQQPEGPQARARHRALDRPLRRHDAVHRRAAQEGGAGLRERGGDGGGHAARLQPHARRPRQARGDLSLGGDVRLRLAVLHAQRGLGVRRAGRGREGVPGVPGRGDHARGRGQVGLPALRSREGARRPDHRRQRRRPEAARARARAARAARAGARSRRRGAATASPRTSCSCSTPRAR